VVVAVSFNKITGRVLPLLWGTNVGGNGLVFASFANLLGLRMLGDVRRKYRIFTRISMTFFILNLAAVIFILKTLGVGESMGKRFFSNFPCEENEVVSVDGARVWELLKPSRDGLEIPFSVAVAEVQRETAPHRLGNWEVYVVLSGKGRFHCEEKSVVLDEGGVFVVPPRAVQWVENLSEKPLKVVCIVYPPWTPDSELGVLGGE